MKVAAYIKILLFVLFLGLGRAVMATTQVQPEVSAISEYGVHNDDHNRFGDLPISAARILHESNSELLSPSNFKSNFNLLSRQAKNNLYLVDWKLLLPFKNKTGIKISLDSLTMIYPFHTFF